MSTIFEFKAAVISSDDFSYRLSSYLKDMMDGSDCVIDRYEGAIDKPEKYDMIFDCREEGKVLFSFVKSDTSDVQNSEIACSKEDKLYVVVSLIEMINGEIDVDVDWYDMQSVICPSCRFISCLKSLDDMKTGMGQIIGSISDKVKGPVVAYISMGSDCTLRDVSDIYKELSDAANGMDVICACKINGAASEENIRIDIFY